MILKPRRSKKKSEDDFTPNLFQYTLLPKGASNKLSRRPVHTQTHSHTNIYVHTHCGKLVESAFRAFPEEKRAQ